MQKTVARLICAIILLWVQALAITPFCYAESKGTISHSVLQTPLATFDVRRTDFKMKKDDFTGSSSEYAFKIASNQFGAKSYEICVDRSRSKLDSAHVALGRCVVARATDFSSATIVRQIRKYNVDSPWNHTLVFTVAPLPRSKTTQTIQSKEGAIKIDEQTGVLAEDSQLFQSTDLHFKAHGSIAEDEYFRVCIDMGKSDCLACIIPAWEVQRLPYGVSSDMPDTCRQVSPDSRELVPLRVLQRLEDPAKRPPKPRFFFTHEVNKTPKPVSDGKRN